MNKQILFVAILVLTIIFILSVLLWSYQKLSEKPEQVFNEQVILQEGESKTIGGLIITLLRTTYPPSGFTAEELGVPSAKDDSEYYVLIKAEEQGDILETINLNQINSTQRFHDYLIKFVEAQDEGVVIRISSSPTLTTISEQEAVRIALDAAQKENMPVSSKANYRNLKGEIWQIRVDGPGFDNFITVSIDASSGKVLRIERSPY